jgi:hypothetical protein
MFGKDIYEHVGGPHGELVKINVPVTLPELTFLTKGPPLDDEPERREVAARFAEHRTVRAGLECWQAIGRAESFEAWVKIGKALQIGRDYSLKATGANRPMGQIYCRTFSAWIDQHGFAAMPKSTRSVAIELHENAEAITAWRDTLPERQRKRLVHPLSVTRRWKAAVQAKEHAVTDTRKAVAAWARFVVHVEALSPDLALPLWRAAQAQAASMIEAT